MNSIRAVGRTLLCAAALAALATSARDAHAASRTVIVKLNNFSDTALNLVSSDLSHGCWSTMPPDRVEPGAGVQWESESCGFATGTEGTAQYRLETGGTLNLHWDNPFFGSNSYSNSIDDVGYRVKQIGNPGEDSEVLYNLSCSSTTCDGIPDKWKLEGVTLDPGDGSGPQFINLPAMGADVNRPDIFIQLDWMADTTHDHTISSAAIQRVVDAFDKSPFVGRNGSVGINLHVDHGPNSIMNFKTNATWGALSRARAVGEVAQLGTSTFDAQGNVVYDWTAFDGIKNALGGFKSTGRGPIFRYALSLHQVADTGIAGIARGIPASDFIVVQSSGTTQDTQSIRFMHELGHTLGLAHGGGDSINFKPNYFSIMNYLFGLAPHGMTGPGGVSVIDYSRVAYGALDENSLGEAAPGVNSAFGWQTAHWCPRTALAPPGRVTVADAAGPIDWNCNGITDAGTVAAEITGDAVTSTAPTPLKGYNDWDILKLKGGAIGGDLNAASQFPIRTIIDELTPEQAGPISPVDRTAPVTVAAISPAPNAAGWNKSDVTVTLVASDALSGVARIDQAVDGSTFLAYTAPLVLGLEGAHTVQFRATDRGLNLEATKQTTVRIDKTLPQSTLTIGTPQYAGGLISSLTPLTLAAADDRSGVASVAYRFYLQGTTAPAYTTTGGATVTFKLTGTDGLYTVDTLVTDVAGNSRSATQAVRLTNSADLKVVSVTATTALPKFLLVGTPVSLGTQTVVTNLGPVAPVDTTVTSTATGSASVTLTPGTSTASASALALNELRTLGRTYSVSCLARSTSTVTIASRISLAAGTGFSDPVSANNTASLTLSVVCKVPWQPGRAYAVGEEVVYNGLVYLARQAHTSQAGWEPPNVYALWERSKADTSGAWAPQVMYVAGDVVTYQGVQYKAILAHQSQTGWEPSVPRVPALWQKL